MTRSAPTVLSLTLTGLAFVLLVAAAPPSPRGHGVVAADQPEAARAGAEILAAGGNAMDAAVATLLAIGVVQPSAAGLGGGGFAVVVDADHPGGWSLDFREVAPAAASHDMFRTADGGIDKDASSHGGRAVAVPGEPRGLWKLLHEHGRLSAKQVAAPAIRLATDGFAVAPYLATRLESSTLTPAVVALFTVGGHPAREGDVVRRAALAKGIRAWVASGGEAFSTGTGAAAVVATVAAAGGAITAEDLAGYAPVERPALVTHYRGYTVVTMAPPSSGGVALAEILGALEGFDVSALGFESSDHLHLLIEAMKHAFADRAHYLGDPAFTDVPVDRLTSPERAAEIQRAIWPGKTFEPAYYGSLIASPVDHGTSHVAVVDRDGMAVSVTSTVNQAFGSGLVVADYGMILNDQMDDFAVAPGVPNAYGLVGDEANAIAPGKRPLSSMSPTIVLDPAGKVVLVVGSSGGAQIISAVAQVISDVIDFGMDPEEAVSAPRVHHQWQPDEAVVEPGIPKDVLDSLRARGHKVVVRDHVSAAQAIVVTDGIAAGGADPRKGGWPATVW
jgi:gamma-glutamyltranspeptidase/glutathione hydrolase